MINLSSLVSLDKIYIINIYRGIKCITFLICYMISRYHVIIKSFDFMGGDPARLVISLTCLMAIGLVELENIFKGSCDVWVVATHP